MAFKMGVSKESLSIKILPAGIYDLRLESFKPARPAATKKPDFQGPYSPEKHGVNFNPRFVVVNSTDEFNGTSIFVALSSKFARAIEDFSHGLGLPLEEQGSNLQLPGNFEGDENDPESAKYVGPLLGRICKAFVEPQTFQGRTSNTIRYYICAVTDCASGGKVKHSTALNKQSQP